MGYTNYWTHTNDFTDKEWLKVLEEFDYILDILENTVIETEYIDRDKCIAFNGIEKEDLDHESFVINKYKKDNELTFCKTVRKPYDIAVWHMLYFIHKETNAFSEISRDR
tara:strand:+ start:677 stop:1006 length:330 start_codon:yes stop_codon:yes gene_type:complete